MTRNLGYLPRSKFRVDFFREPGALVLQSLNFFINIQLIVVADQAQFSDLGLQLSDGLIKYEIIRVH